MNTLAGYGDFLRRKFPAPYALGFDPGPIEQGGLFDYQRAIVRWAVRQGRAAIFAGTGLGKTAMQAAWAEQVRRFTLRPVLILAPLAVAPQTVREGEKFGIKIRHVREHKDILGPGIYVTNYEALHKFRPEMFGGVCLDESSILKAFTGATKRKLCESFEDSEVTKFKLACTATPSPNDFMEIGNHAEFLGVMKSTEMLMRFFTADSMQAGKYRIKRHAEKDFWRWLASWSVAFTRPSDLGYQDQPGHVLPELRQHVQEAEVVGFPEPGDPPMLFKTECVGALSIHRERRLTIEDRARITAEIVAAEDSPCVVWVDTNYEADAIRALIPQAIEVRGSDKAEEKEERLHGFSLGSIRCLITKPSIAGYGLNWQGCHRMVFAGLSFSFEDMHQAVRRCWRFGQTNPVDVHVIATHTESQVLRAITRKAEQHELMIREVAACCRENGLGAGVASPKLRGPEETASLSLPSWLKSESAA